MNECKKFQQFITDAVDNRLDETDKEFFEAHLTQCMSCRNDYELDILTKDFVKSKITRQTTPQDVALRIKEEIEKQVITNRRTKGVFSQFPLARAAVIAMLVVGVAFLLYFLNSPDMQNTVQAADMMDKSIENYGLFLAGTIQPQQIGQNVEELRDYFYERVDFPVALKPVKDCEWVGGVLSDYDGLPLAHLVYKLPGGIVYVYQANWQAVLEGSKISLSNGAVTSLNQTGWYINGTHDDYSVVMWLYNEETVCTAVSSMEEEQLRDMFATETQ